MSLSKKSILKTKGIVNNFLMQQSDRDILRILNGERELVIIKKDKASCADNEAEKVSKRRVEAKDVLKKLKKFKSEQEGKAYLYELGISTLKLKAIAKMGDVYVPIDAKKDEVINLLSKDNIKK